MSAVKTKKEDLGSHLEFNVFILQHFDIEAYCRNGLNILV